MADTGRNCRLAAAAAVLLKAVIWGAPALAASCPEGRVALRGDFGETGFSVEIADDPEERARGLMFRESMASGAGMLFVYEQPGPARFWMKNTPLALDMIFADARGVVTHVHSQAKPLDETPIDGGDAVQFVLEINAGLASRLGIVPGAEMRHPAIDQADAIWPCVPGS